MPIGKDSITKRVAKTANEEKNIAPELVATSAAAPKAETKKAPAKKPAPAASKTASTAKKPTTAKKPAVKKDTVTEKVTPPAAKKVDTAIIPNIAPETAAAVIGHKENSGFEKVQLGEKLPVHLL